jgi:preprotein translocase SecE subunit
MEDNKKIITVSLALFGILVGFVTHFLLEFLAGSIAFMNRLYANEIFSTGVPVLVGAVVFGVLQFNRKSQDFSDGVVAELKKVVWPSQKDTGLMTVVVVITLIISGIVVGIYDSVWAYVINLIVR